MVILVKSWRGNIDVKLFTTIGHKSWLVNLLRKMLKIFQDIPKELLRKSWEQFPGNSQELVMKNFSLEISKHFHEFCRHFLRFFCRIGNKKFPGIGGKKFLGQSYEKILGMGCKKFLGPGSSEQVTRNSSEQMSTFSPDFPVKDSWEFPWIPRKDSWEFPRILGLLSRVFLNITG